MSCNCLKVEVMEGSSDKEASDDFVEIPSPILSY